MSIQITIHVSGELHPDSALLVQKFALAMAGKLLRNQEKYGWLNEWNTRPWEDECRAGMMEHIKKGDPMDVAIYAAFMWYRGWNTAISTNHENQPDEALPDQF